MHVYLVSSFHMCRCGNGIQDPGLHVDIMRSKAASVFGCKIEINNII